MPLNALALNATLKTSDAKEASSTDRMIALIDKALSTYDVKTEVLRLADFNVKPGVTSDEGAGDDWPDIRTKVLAADILLMATPIWLGQPSSVCKRALERMDALSMRPTIRAAWFPMAGSRPSPSSAMRTAPIMCRPSFSKR